MHGDRPCKPTELVNSRPTASPTGRRRVSGRSKAPDYEAFFHERGFVDRADGALFAAARERFERDERRAAIQCQRRVVRVARVRRRPPQSQVHASCARMTFG
eukprot:scaffold54095_cov77-Phaeocystis_antarctica.AAC.1